MVTICFASLLFSVTSNSPWIFLSIHVLFVNILTEKNKTIENKIKNQQTKSVLKNMKCQIGYIDRIYR